MDQIKLKKIFFLFTLFMNQIPWLVQEECLFLCFFLLLETFRYNYRARRNFSFFLVQYLVVVALEREKWIGAVEKKVSRIHVYVSDSEYSNGIHTFTVSLCWIFFSLGWLCVWYTIDDDGLVLLVWSIVANVVANTHTQRENTITTTTTTSSRNSIYYTQNQILELFEL